MYSKLALVGTLLAAAVSATGLVPVSASPNVSPNLAKTWGNETVYNGPGGRPGSHINVAVSGGVNLPVKIGGDKLLDIDLSGTRLWAAVDTFVDGQASITLDLLSSDILDIPILAHLDAQLVLALTVELNVTARLQAGVWVHLGDDSIISINLAKKEIEKHSLANVEAKVAGVTVDGLVGADVVLAARVAACVELRTNVKANALGLVTADAAIFAKVVIADLAIIARVGHGNCLLEVHEKLALFAYVGVKADVNVLKLIDVKAKAQVVVLLGNVLDVVVCSPDGSPFPPPGLPGGSPGYGAEPAPPGNGSGGSPPGNGSGGSPPGNGSGGSPPGSGSGGSPPGSGSGGSPPDSGSPGGSPPNGGNAGVTTTATTTDITTTISTTLTVTATPCPEIGQVTCPGATVTTVTYTSSTVTVCPAHPTGPIKYPVDTSVDVPSPAGNAAVMTPTTSSSTVAEASSTSGPATASATATATTTEKGQAPSPPAAQLNPAVSETPGAPFPSTNGTLPVAAAFPTGGSVSGNSPVAQNNGALPEVSSTFVTAPSATPSGPLVNNAVSPEPVQAGAARFGAHGLLVAAAVFALL